MYQPEPVYTISPILRKSSFYIKLNKSERDHELYTESDILEVIIKSSDRIQKLTNKKKTLIHWKIWRAKEYHLQFSLWIGSVD